MEVEVIFLKIMADNFPRVIKVFKLQIQETMNCKQDKYKETTIEHKL